MEESLTMLRSYVVRLRTYAEISLEDLSADIDKQFAAKHTLQLAVERVKDITDVLVGRPTGDRGRATRLVDATVIPDSKRSCFDALVCLRDRLVHEYEFVSVNAAYKALQYAPDRLDEFASSVIQFLKKEGVE